MAKNQKSFIAKFAALPLATKIISAVCVVVIIAGSATAAVLLSSPNGNDVISGNGGLDTGEVSSAVINPSSDTSADEDVVVSNDTPIESTPSGTTLQGGGTTQQTGGTSTEVPSNPVSQPSSVSSQAPVSSESSVSSAAAPAPSSSTPAPSSSTPAGAVNEFFNSTNYADSLNTGNVTIKPRLVYWEDGMLQAECFVINGLNVPVYNIRVNNLRFYNGAGTMAQAGFGLMQANNQFNGSIGANSYTVWTFTFPSNCVFNYGADLSRLGCEADTTYNH